jgi:hypothetical protein
MAAAHSSSRCTVLVERLVALASSLIPRSGRRMSKQRRIVTALGDRLDRRTARSGWIT